MIDCESEKEDYLCILLCSFARFDMTNIRSFRSSKNLEFAKAPLVIGR